jgi:hypothetical protein
VRGLLKWLMVLGILSGALLRAMPHHHCHDHCAGNGHCGGHGHHEHSCPDEEPPGEHQGENSSPHDDGHVHFCCFAAPMLISEAAVHRLPMIHCQLQRISSDGVLMPEGPVFELELPPLI